MRNKPGLWTGADRIQWGCTLMQILGEDSLAHLHLMLTGLRSVEHSFQAVGKTRSVQTARMLLSDLQTRKAVEDAAYIFVSDGKHRSFVIDPKTLRFTTEYADGVDPNIVTAREILAAGLPRQVRKIDVADTNRDLVVYIDQETSLPIRLHNLDFPPVRQHDQTQRLRQPIIVSMVELQSLAFQLDEEDRIAGRISSGWVNRLEQMRLQMSTGQGLRETDVLDLTNLKHLIGLPGAGKSTLITLLCILLSRRGQRAAVFFTSIQVAREYLSIFRRYAVRTAILMGSSDQTHRRHADALAEQIAGFGDGGFGYTEEAVDLFATSCPLPAFSNNPNWIDRWPIAFAPCENLYDAESHTRVLCPAWELCGRVKNQRELVSADVWVGHILSAETMVPAHTSSERIRYFELIGETFDLVIFDECDDTQKMLDGHGTLTLQLTGNDESVHIKIQKLTGQLAANRTWFTDAMLNYSMRANEFERHMLRFLAEIRRLGRDRRTEKLVRDFTNLLLTSNFLLSEALKAAETTFDTQEFSAISEFWERAMYSAFYFRADESTVWDNVEKYAPALRLDVEVATEAWLKVNKSLRSYLAQDHAAAATEIIEDIVTVMVKLLRANSADQIREHIRLLIVVGFTVASYQRLATSARPLVQRGEVDTGLVFAKASVELREIVPRSIMGAFSAVRYRPAQERDGYEVDYLVLDAVPRLLLHRLHEFGRANVLLASATSWMEGSTEYHVEKKPDYIISPKVGEAGPIHLYLLPKLHPFTRKPLRFSGGGAERENNLRHMVTALASPDISKLSELERAVHSMKTSLDRSRKAALVVNSYDQVQLVVEHIAEINPSLGTRTRGVVNQLPAGTMRARYVLKGQVEELGRESSVDVIVFPIGALGRGINILFPPGDEDEGRAAVGSVYFLTRPHPSASDLGLLTSLQAQATQDLDSQDFRNLLLSEVQRRYNQARKSMYKRVENLLSRPLSASLLDEKTRKNFAANLLVPILQTIGRAMRKRMPVDVYFVDAAWAPNSAEERPETAGSSLLVLMANILKDHLDSPDPDRQGIYQALYGVFYEAFCNIRGLHLPVGRMHESTNLFDPSGVTVAFDLEDYLPPNGGEAEGNSISIFDEMINDYYDDEGAN